MADMDAAKLRFDQEKSNSWPVGDLDHLRGVISSHQIDMADPRPNTVRDLFQNDGKFPYVHADHPLTHALEQMRDNGIDVVPVVSRANIHQMNGVVALTDILSTYGVGGKPETGMAK